MPLLPHHSHIRNVSMFNSPWSQVITNLIFIMSMNWTENVAGNKRWGAGAKPHPTLNKSNLYHTIHCVHGPANSGGGYNDASRVTAPLYHLSTLWSFKYISKITIRIIKHKILKIINLSSIF